MDFVTMSLTFIQINVQWKIFGVKFKEPLLNVEELSFSRKAYCVRFEELLKIIGEQI